MKKSLLFLLMLLFCAPVLAQSNDSLVVLFLSQPGVRPAQIFTDGFESGDLSRFDASGDGTVDLILQRDDAGGNLQDLLVINAASLDTLWRVVNVPATLGLPVGASLWGFADPLGTGTPLGFLVTDGGGFFGFRTANNALALSWEANNGSSARFLGALDLTDDGLQELIVYLTDTKQVEIWTKAD